MVHKTLLFASLYWVIGLEKHNALQKKNSLLSIYCILVLEVDPILSVSMLLLLLNRL